MSVAASNALRRTPLYEAHRALGARLVPFAGWEMPVSYEGVRQEHIAVRTSAGVFDVSHMGQLGVFVPAAPAALQRLLSNDVERIEPGGAQYSLLCRDDGGVLDDVFAYRLEPDRFLVVTNASNHERDAAWTAERATGFDCTVADLVEDYAMLALQGPQSRALLAPLLGGDAPARFHVAKATVCGREALIAGTGYSGEDGVEILLAPGDATAVWDGLLAAGAVPCGLGARDTLRTEVCYPLYGNELSLERNPIEAGLGWACAEQSGFIGAEAVREVRQAGPVERLAAFVIAGQGIARQGNPVVGGGEVTSGTFSPCLEHGIGMAYLPSASAVPGTDIEIDVRGKLRPAVVREKPLYRKER